MSLALVLFSLVTAALIQNGTQITATVFNGGGLQTGLGIAAGIQGPLAGGGGANGLRSPIINVLRTVLSFLSLVAVITIVIAGIYMIMSNGNEDAKNKAKTIILYTVIGLLIIFFARVIVGVITSGSLFA